MPLLPLPPPAYRAGGVTVYHGRAAELLRRLPPRSVDAIVTDPPWAVGVDYDGYADTPANLDQLIAEFMPEALRVGRVVAVLPGVANAWRYPEPTWTLAWLIRSTAGTGRWGFNCWQPVLVYGTDPYLSAGLGRRPDTIDCPGGHAVAEKNGHPCPKPLRLMELLVRRVTTKIGQTVLDPFLGSGTTALACLRTGRRCLGVEASATYCALAAREIEDCQSGRVLSGLRRQLARRRSAHPSAVGSGRETPNGVG